MSQPAEPHWSAAEPEEKPARWEIARRAWSRRLDNFVWGGADSASSSSLLGGVRRWMQIIDRSLRGYFQHDGLTEASGLTYTTLLTIVPLLAIALAVFSGFGLHRELLKNLKDWPVVKELTTVHSKNQRFQQSFGVLAPPISSDGTQPAGQVGPPSPEKIEEQLRTVGPPAPGAAAPPIVAPTVSIVPAEAEVITGAEMVDKAIAFIGSTDIKKLGTLGIFGLLFSIMAMLAKIEKAMNRAWSIQQRRTLGRMVGDYFNILLVLIFMLIGLSVTVSSRFADNVPGFKTMIGLAPYLIVWPAFAFMYYFMPNTRVRWRSAVMGALVAGLAYQIAQYLFTLFIGILFDRYDKLYGAFAALVVLLLWVFMSWCILLWGVEVSNVYQNLRDWRRRRRAWRGTPAERETLALRMAALLARPLISGSPADRLDDGDLADILQLPPEPIAATIAMFKKNGLAVQSTEENCYLLSRAPDKLTVLDVMRLAREGKLEPSEHEPMLGAIGEASEKYRAALQDLTIRQLAELPMDKIQTFRL